MRKVYITLSVKTILRIDEGVEVKDVMDELEIELSDTTGTADIEDVELANFEVTDSK